MIKNKNPAVGIIQAMAKVSKANNSPTIQIGKIVQPPPEIKIAYQNIFLEKDEVWIPKNLLAGYERTAKGHLTSATQNKSGGSGDAAYESHNHDINNDYTDNIIYTDTLKVGDYVGIMPMESSDDGSKQQYMIVNHIVRLDGGG